jgi:hypothetical protein
MALEIIASTVKPKFVPAVKPSRWVASKLASDTEFQNAYAKCVKFALRLSKTEMQKMYRHEYTSLRGARERAKKRHLAFDERLRVIRDWLVHLGPRPATGWTVHRPKFSKGYLVGNVVWADKQTQTEERKVTKWHKVGDQMLTTKNFAKHLGVSYGCLYKRLARSWTVKRLLENAEKLPPVEAWTFPAPFASELEKLYGCRKARNMPRIVWYLIHLSELTAKKPAPTPDQYYQIMQERQRVTQELHELQEIEAAAHRAHVEGICAAISSTQSSSAAQDILITPASNCMPIPVASQPLSEL